MSLAYTRLANALSLPAFCHGDRTPCAPSWTHSFITTSTSPPSRGLKPANGAIKQGNERCCIDHYGCASSRKRSNTSQTTSSRRLFRVGKCCRRNDPRGGGTDWRRDYDCDGVGCYECRYRAPSSKTRSGKGTGTSRGSTFTLDCNSRSRGTRTRARERARRAR